MNFKRIAVNTVTAFTVAAISMLSLTACIDEKLNITNVPEESELSSSSTPSIEPESSSAITSKARNCDEEGLTVGSVCVRKEHNPICDVKVWCGDGLVNREYVYMGDSVFETFDNIAEKTACSAENENSKQKLTYGDESFQKTEYYMCVGYRSNNKATSHPDEDPMVYWWKNINEVEYNCSVKYSDGYLAAAHVGEICSFESSEGMQNYLSIYSPIMERNLWKKFEPNSELGPCPTEYQLGRLFSKSGENVYKCLLGEWVLTEEIVPQQYLDPRKNSLTDEEYDVLELPQNPSVGDRAAGLLEDCAYHKELSSFICNSELADDELAYTRNCWTHKYYDNCEPRNYYRYRENGSWTLETDEDRLNDSRFQVPECSEERKDSTFEVPPQPGKPGEVYRCLWLPRYLQGGVNKLSDYVFHRAEDNKMF